MKRIGLIGKTSVSPTEADHLVRFGELLAALGHILVVVEAKGSSAKVREGIERQGGHTTLVDRDVIEQSDVTFLYPDTHLLNRLLDKYGQDLTERFPIIMLTKDTLPKWTKAMEVLLIEKSLPVPTGRGSKEEATNKTSRRSRT
jgi:hypothetical protein